MNVPVTRVCDLRLSSGDPEFDAWLFNLLVDNNLVHRINPSLIASDEQLRFMVHLEPGQVYLPCSDQTFLELAREDIPPALQAQYDRSWRIVSELLDSLPYTEEERSRIASFCLYRFRQAVAGSNVIPSRLVKRLTSYALSLAEDLGDPWIERKRHAVAWQKEHLASEDVRAAIDAIVPGQADSTSIRARRRAMDLLHFARYASLCANVRAWSERFPGREELEDRFQDAERKFKALPGVLDILDKPASTVLYLADADGGALYDALILRFFLSRGHRVIYAVKDGFYFHNPTLQDIADIPELAEAFKGAWLCKDKAVTKNELLRLLREWRLIVLSDGTRERLNLARTSVAFARAWKEADLVVAHGWRKRKRLIETSAEFTRDILCWWEDKDGFQVRLRRHHPAERKFTELELSDMADGIIAGMRDAKARGQSVMFYSCVIGSIPGEVKTASALVCAFVKHLRERMPNAYVVNPAEHFVEGMDGDDLMYMWEKVQRSGLISIWRFQTAEDIETAFALLGREVPPKWVGKDSTYSTGCTKEMRIACDVQRSNPEMQIIGPSPDKFFRRSDYGVGKYFDATLAHR